MTREDFIVGYVKRSGFEITEHGLRQARLGFFEIDGDVFIALPCACGEDNCVGWALIGAKQAHSHLFFRAPEPLMSAYRSALEAAKEKPPASEEKGT